MHVRFELFFPFEMGKQACDTFVVFVAAQRLCMFAPTFVAAAHRRGARNVMRAFTENVALLFGLASLEMYTMTAVSYTHLTLPTICSV